MNRAKLFPLLIFIATCLSVLVHANEIKKVDTDGDGVPDTYVISGVEKNNPSAITSTSQEPKPAGRVDINTASFEELCSLPRIGKNFAQAIIAGRLYTRIEEITKIKGIGPVTYENLKNLITVGEKIVPPIDLPENILSAYCTKVFDGDTIVVRDTGSSSRKVRLVGIDTPEVKHGRKRAQPGGYAAKKFTKASCLSKIVYLDIDDKKPKDRYQRTLALVYLTQEDASRGECYSLNAMLLRGGHAKILYMPPSEFNPHSWKEKK